MDRRYASPTLQDVKKRVEELAEESKQERMRENLQEFLRSKDRKELDNSMIGRASDNLPIDTSGNNTPANQELLMNSERRMLTKRLNSQVLTETSEEYKK